MKEAAESRYAARRRKPAPGLDRVVESRETFDEAAPRGAALFDRYRLGEVARLIDVQAAQPGNAIGEQLQGEDRERGLQERRGPRHVDDVVSVVLDVLVAVGGDCDDLGAARPGLLDVGDDLVVDV